MTTSLTDLRTTLENNGVTVKYLSKGILCCHGDTKYTRFKIFKPGNDTFQVKKNALNGTIWSENFDSKHDLAEFLQEKQNPET